jgi:hypothetical protein
MHVFGNAAANLTGGQWLYLYVMLSLQAEAHDEHAINPDEELVEIDDGE